MSASVNDKFSDTRNAARPVSTTVSVNRSAGATTLTCSSLTGWPTASKVHFVTYKIDTNSDPVAGTQLDCYGIVSGSSITSMTVVDGTDSGHAVGDVVEMLPTSVWGQDLSDGLLVAHNRDGSLQTVAVSKGGTGNTTLTQSGILYGNGTSAIGVTAAGTSNQVLTSNGASAPTWQTNSGTGYLILLYANSGTNTSAAAANVDTYAISGLAAKDSLLFIVDCSSLTQATATPITIYSSTDGTRLADLSNANLTSGQTLTARTFLMQSQQSASTYNGNTLAGATTTASTPQATANAFLSSQGNALTAWTGSWTVALRHSGVTAGGTFRYSWKIYKVAGQ